MKSRMRIQSNWSRSGLFLAVLLAVVVAFTFGADGEMRAQSPPPSPPGSAEPWPVPEPPGHAGPAPAPPPDGYPNPGPAPGPPGSTNPGGVPPTLPDGSTNPGGVPRPPGHTNPGTAPGPPGSEDSGPTPEPPEPGPAPIPTATAWALPIRELTATATVRGVELRWEAVPNAVRYDIRMWDSAEGHWLQIGGDNLTGTSYTHTDVQPGRTYYYTVRAVNGAGVASGWLKEYSSATALGGTSTPTPTLTSTSTPTATATAIATPPAPLVLQLPVLTAEATVRGVALRWEAVPNAARYDLRTWGESEGRWLRIGGDNLTGTTYTHTDVRPGKTHYYLIRGMSAAGVPGPWSRNYLSVTALAATSTPTATPTSTATTTATPTATAPALQAPALTVEATAQGVVLRWEAAPNAVRYELMAWWDSGSGWQRIGGDNLAGTTYTHTGVRAGTTYFYTIRAVNAAGESSGWLMDYPGATALAATGSETSTPTPTQTPTPGPTPTPTATAAAVSVPTLKAEATAQGVLLTWTAVSDAVRYELLAWWEEKTGWQPIGGDQLTGTSYRHADAAHGTTYYYSIRAVNAAGEAGGWQMKFPSATVR